MLSRRGLLLALSSLPLVAAPAPAFAAELPILGVATDGRDLAAGDLGGWRLVYFGYTHCPDVCPLGLQTMAEAVEALGPFSAAITPVFVTVDPDRDTPAVMKDYVAFFHPRLIGVTPSPEQLAIMAKAWRIKFAKVDVGAGRPYLMDHTAAVILVDPQNRAAGRFPHDIGGAHLADRIRGVLMARA